MRGHAHAFVLVVDDAGMRLVIDAVAEFEIGVGGRCVRVWGVLAAAGR